MGDFYGVYMLYCLNPMYKGRIYVGFTTNPKRRLAQHNKGVIAGGARRTSNRGPWEMRLLVHGFPNKIAALAFEWAWQHPVKSRRLKGTSVKLDRSTKNGSFKYHVAVMDALLSVGPWCRLPLRVTWMSGEYMEISKLAPLHISWELSLTTLKPSHGEPEESDSETVLCPTATPSVEICYICMEQVIDKLACKIKTCNAKFHLVCLAKCFSDSLLPVKGKCPVCRCCLLWGDLLSSRNILLR